MRERASACSLCAVVRLPAISPVYRAISAEVRAMRAVAIVLGAVSAFFVFYTIRLLAVTHMLQQTRAGGQGAYIGAVVFPVLAIAFGWAALRCWRRASQ